MVEKLLEIEQKYLSLTEELIRASNEGNVSEMTSLNKQVSQLEEIYSLFQEYKKAADQIKEAKDILATESDSELIEMAKAQMNDEQKNLDKIEDNLKIALLPKDPNDDKNIYLEIRPAAGGDEAGLFAAEVLKMYMNYAQKMGRKTEIVETQYSDVGGLKFAMVKMSGYKVYSIMKFESGVHRVQRIPATESNGRVHTSTITVAIMPEVDDVEVKIDAKDVTMDTYAASSAGGQNANKNQTGVRLHHLPSGLIVTIGDSKSQLQNKEKARQVLKSRLYQIEQDKQMAETRQVRGD
ncbi:MAG TPA: PCRF domain-containing protein, partial [Candidatus Absconditabacterales bacterium]|nr:PCRF domain-containing protein [Candidatus Absconditabacterales bacterium]